MTYSYEDKEIFDEKVRQFMIREGWDKLSKEELLRVVSEQLEVMVKDGDVEQLIGEDGEFYYRKAT
jgi:membrane protease subunit (stomatin/prohibitin family)